MISITILIPAYNAEKTIKRALLSIENQTYKGKFDVIIVDDGSTDNTAQVIRDTLPELSFTPEYIYEENKGVTAARYLGVTHVKTDFVFGLDADDELEKDALEKLTYIWNNLRRTEKQRFGGVCSLSRDYQTNKVQGKKFPSNINKCSQRRYTKYRHAGERSCLIKTECYKNKYELGVRLSNEFRTKNISEIIMHVSYERNNRLFCVNEITQIYHTENQDSLCHQRPTRESYVKAYNEQRYLLMNFGRTKNFYSIYRLRIMVRLCWLGKALGISFKQIKKECNITGINNVLLLLANLIGFVVYNLKHKAIIQEKGE